MRAFSQDISPREAAVHIYLEQQKCSVHTPASRNQGKPSPPRAPSPIPPIAPASSPDSPTLVSYTAVNCPSRATKLLYTRLTRIWLPRQHREAAQPATTPRDSSSHGNATWPFNPRHCLAPAQPTAPPRTRSAHGTLVRPFNPRHRRAAVCLERHATHRQDLSYRPRRQASNLPISRTTSHKTPLSPNLGTPRKPTRTCRVEIAPSKCRPSVPASGATCMPSPEILRSPTHQQSHGTPPAIASAPTRAAK